MAKRIYKPLVILLLFALIFPMTSMLCCCIGEASHSHEHQQVKANHEHAHHHEHAESDSRSHSNCDHNSLLSPFLIQESARFFECLSKLFTFHQKSLPLETLLRKTSVASSQLQDTGPPGLGFPLIPFYLEVSVLRI